MRALKHASKHPKIGTTRCRIHPILSLIVRMRRESHSQLTRANNSRHVSPVVDPRASASRPLFASDIAAVSRVRVIVSPPRRAVPAKDASLPWWGQPKVGNMRWHWRCLRRQCLTDRQFVPDAKRYSGVVQADEKLTVIRLRVGELDEMFDDVWTFERLHERVVEAR